MTPAVTAAQSDPAPAPYLSRPLPSLLILAAFFLLALPLSLPVFTGQGELMSPLLHGYVLVFGLTHFFLTFTVYLSAANRRHFTSSARNAVVFVGVPLLLFTGLFVWWGFGFDARFATAAVALSFIIRGLDFMHFTRQAFGVLQLFKVKLGAQPAWLRPAENVFLLSLGVLMYATFVTQGAFDASAPFTRVALVACASLGLGVLTGYALALKAGAEPRRVALSLGYLALQTASGLLAVYRTELYFCTLAIHYVEYHLIMGRRVFHMPLEPSDRALAAVRRFPVLLYGVLLAAVAVFFFMRRAQEGAPAGFTGVAVHLFDGLFVFHYVIEMAIWKMGDPYFRKSLGPLYS